MIIPSVNKIIYQSYFILILSLIFTLLIIKNNNDISKNISSNPDIPKFIKKNRLLIFNSLILLFYVCMLLLLFIGIMIYIACITMNIEDYPIFKESIKMFLTFIWEINYKLTLYYLLIFVLLSIIWVLYFQMFKKIEDKDRDINYSLFMLFSFSIIFIFSSNEIIPMSFIISMIHIVFFMLYIRFILKKKIGISIIFIILSLLIFLIFMNIPDIKV